MDEEPEVAWEIEDEFDQIDLAEFAEKDGTPEVSGEQLKALDREAMLKEVEMEKLKEMEVIGSIPTNMTADDALQLDTKNVFDWRYRQNQWTRRCRIVAKEFQGQRQHSGYICTYNTMEWSENIAGNEYSDEAQGCSI